MRTQGASERGLVAGLSPLAGGHFMVGAVTGDDQPARGAPKLGVSPAPDTGSVHAGGQVGSRGDGEDLGERDAQGKHHLKRPGWKAHTSADGSVHFEDGSAEAHFWGPFIIGTFDITDWLMRRYTDDDPYNFAKAKFLDQTREERQAMALRWRQEKLQEAVQRLPGWLDELWRAPGRSLVERRRLLFELWDECAEEGPDDVVATAKVVRGTIEGFVRKRLPAGSAEAYGEDELRQLNAGRGSRREFRPYDPR